MSTETSTLRPGIPLRCPCGGRFSVDLSWRGPRHLSEQIPDGYECDDTSCWAAWDRDGIPTSVPASEDVAS